MDACPITGKPLTMPGAIIHPDAAQMLTVKTNNLIELVDLYYARLEGRSAHNEGRAPIGESRAPLSLGILDACSNHLDTIEAWAAHILTMVNPSARMRPGDWRMVEAIYQRHVPQRRSGDRKACFTKWEWAPDCITQVDHAINALRLALGVTGPPPPHVDPADMASVEDREEQRAHLSTLHLPARQAALVIHHMTGKNLPVSTIYWWEQRGKIKGSGDPKRYPVADLEALIGAG